MKYMIKIRSEP